MANFQLGITLVQATAVIVHVVPVVFFVNNNQWASAFASFVEVDVSDGIAAKASKNVIYAMSNIVNASIVMVIA